MNKLALKQHLLIGLYDVETGCSLGFFLLFLDVWWNFSCNSVKNCSCVTVFKGFYEKFLYCKLCFSISL